jgi:hypothetical protein
MRFVRILIATALFMAFNVPSFAACILPLTHSDVVPGGIGFRLSWEPIASATNYEVQQSPDNFLHVTTLLTLPTGSTGVTVKQLTSASHFYSYRVIAINATNPSDIPCTGTISTFVIGSGFGQRVNRIVLPVVGSTRGQNNASFKTSLRLGPAPAPSAGKLIFHPAGRAGSDDDPSIPYSLERGQSIQFDDIVAEIGQSGIGSLDIVQTFPTVEPKVTSVLPVEARLFNEGPGGTYGAFEAPVLPTDAYQPLDWNIFVPSSRFRVNIGIRTLTQTHVTFSLIPAGGGLRLKIADFPPDYVFLDSADHFFGQAVNPGDTIVINVRGDDVIAIPFHTFTDNSTNDPAVFNPQSPTRAIFPVLEVATAIP